VRTVVFDNRRPRNAAATAMHGYLGRDGMSPAELLEQGRQEVAKYGVEQAIETVISVEPFRQGPEHPYRTGFIVHCESGRVVRCRKLLFATGMSDELPTVPGAAECYGRSVHHCPYCDGWEHRDRRLLAFGSTPEAAAGLGLLLRGWSNDVTVLTGRGSLPEEYADRLKRQDVGVVEGELAALAHKEGRMEAAVLADGQRIEAEALFFNTRHYAHSDLPKRLGCEMHSGELVRTFNRQRTCVAGAFLAGDADGDVQFVIVAAAEGATAALAIHRELRTEDEELLARDPKP
jgi:thioredoxin reductase